MTDKAHLLVVDDDDRLRKLLGRFLRESGFDVSLAANTAQARKLLSLFVFDLLVLDVMLPGESGLEFAAAQKEKTLPPVLVLSARTEAQDRIAGLEIGADDYVTKPFEPKELLLRVQAILRRSSKQSGKTETIRFGDYCFDTGRSELSDASGEIVHLTTGEAALLLLLAGQAGKPISRDKLAEAIGSGDSSGRSVDVQVTRLRKKIEPEHGRPRYIQTVRGEGYMLQGSRET